MARPGTTWGALLFGTVGFWLSLSIWHVVALPPSPVLIAATLAPLFVASRWLRSRA